MIRKILLVPLLLSVLGGCASAPERGQTEDINSMPEAEQSTQNQAVDPVAGQSVNDPFEGINRAIWTFNWEYLDPYVLRPVAVAYADYMPGFARTGLLNAAINLEEPVNTVNNLLQGKVGGSMISIGRFLVNSTLGLLGTIDVASEMGLAREEEEFEEVLGVWGVGAGPYLMLPAMGPRDVRGGVSMVADSAYFPLDDLSWQLSLARRLIKALETRVSLIQQEQLINNAVDPYAMVRNIYLQNLEYRIKDGEVEKTEQEAELEEDIDAYLEGL
ncbi:MlaA family lipoprotein [Lacimicrobium alkaliphilum]|uniref:ABC transporter n=1 Tax=Lacimicrobium alkaliphilum TaxID=1526571 RepID=A0ABQ1RMB7_9ALTE|nr:VacJ family lipoprotein [Lacimicrobium alkaliphilum]GGD72710.1 ABC transporter [Lacimicrobium alkaliphilum]